jgi:hypothetical protein
VSCTTKETCLKLYWVVGLHSLTVSHLHVDGSLRPHDDHTVCLLGCGALLFAVATKALSSSCRHSSLAARSFISTTTCNTHLWQSSRKPPGDVIGDERTRARPCRSESRRCRIDTVLSHRSLQRICEDGMGRVLPSVCCASSSAPPSGNSLMRSSSDSSPSSSLCDMRKNSRMLEQHRRLRPGSPGFSCSHNICSTWQQADCIVNTKQTRLARLPLTLLTRAGDPPSPVTKRRIFRPRTSSPVMRFKSLAYLSPNN